MGLVLAGNLSGHRVHAGPAGAGLGPVVRALVVVAQREERLILEREGAREAALQARQDVLHAALQGVIGAGPVALELGQVRLRPAHEAAFRAQLQSRIDAEVAKQEARAQLIIAVCFLPAFMLLILIPMLLSIVQELFG